MYFKKDSTNSKRFPTELKQRTWKKAVRDFFEGYMNSCSLHGFKYIADQSFWKSLFWVCVMIASIVFCAIFIMVQMKKFQENVLTTTISSTADPVWAIPFPAITVCNNIVVSQSGAANIKRILRQNGIEGEEVDRYLEMLNGFVTNQVYTIDNIEIYRHISSILNESGYNPDRIMFEVALPCKRQFDSCLWKMKEEDCSRLFYMIKTNRGYCCSFNAYGAIRYQYHNGGNLSKVIHFAGSVGENSGLVATLNILGHENLSSSSPMPGFEVYIHDGQDYPDFSLFAKTVLPATSLTISLTPSVIDSKPSIKAIRPQDRGCRFEDEYYLSWSTTYNFQTCLHECKADIIYSLCRCLPYYYPNTGLLRICDLEDIVCLRKNEKNVNNLVMAGDNDYATDKLIYQHLGEVRECDCLPDCNDVRYEMSINSVTSNAILNENTSLLRIHYSTISCIRYSKDIYFTWDMFVAAIGGIFGLCLGGSIISLIELLYYITTYFTCKKMKIDEKPTKRNQHQNHIKDEKPIRILYPVYEYTP